MLPGTLTPLATCARVGILVVVHVWFYVPTLLECMNLKTLEGSDHG